MSMPCDRNMCGCCDSEVHGHASALTRWGRKYMRKVVPAGLRYRSGYNLQNVAPIKRRPEDIMSNVCHNFVQNAWKKDFCSNCFKSKDEHRFEVKSDTDKYFATPFQPKSSFFSKATKSPSSILKLSSKKKNKRSVSFPADICKIIGYGGEEWLDEEEFELSEDTEEDDVFPITEEEKELQSITKSNTDFNTVKANLLTDNTEAKKSYTSLLLGKTQTDSDGKKKTLLVSVTPFGHDNSPKNALKLPDKKVSLLSNNKEIITKEVKSSVLLTSFMKNTETIIDSKSTKKEIISKDIGIEKSLLEEISETLEKNRMSKVSNEILTTADRTSIDTVDARKEIENHSVDVSSYKTEVPDIKKISIVRNAPINKNLEKPKVNPTSRTEFMFCKIKIGTSTETGNLDKNSSLDTTSFTSDDDSFSGKTDSDNDDSGNYIEAHNIVKKNEESLKIHIFNDKDTDSGKASSEVSLDDIRKVDGQSDSLQECYERSYTSKILDMPAIIPKLPNADIFSIEASRELAGEPDGRADSDDSAEAPALPSSPIPTIVDPRPSFLHGMIIDNHPIKPAIPEKPKVPLKPLTMLKHAKRPQANVLPQQHQVIMQLQQALNSSFIKPMNHELKTFKSDSVENVNFEECTEAETSEVVEVFNHKKQLLSKQDSNSSDCKAPNKRKAPKPPPSPTQDEIINGKYQRNPTANTKSDSPVVREKEKRERASSCSPKFRQGVNSNPSGDIEQKLEKIPEPAPRRSISLSHDNLIVDDKRKSKLKFSIKKLLRIGSSKDLDKKDLHSSPISKLGSTIKLDDPNDSTPKPKPRLVIIHPLELNGSSVEVVKSNNETGDNLRRLSQDDVSLYSGSSSMADLDIATPKSGTPQKPLPPPRSSSDEGRNAIDGCPVKPARPPPPKSAQLLKQQKQPTWSNSPAASKPIDNVYANLGEVRSAIAPRKPERTASMRERDAQLELPKWRNQNTDDKEKHEDDSVEIPVEATNEHAIHNYDDVYASEKFSDETNLHDFDLNGRNSGDSDYEYVNNQRNSSPECDAIDNKINADSKVTFYGKGENDTNTDYPKFINGFSRSTSLPYCGSETESEIYSPYSFYSCSELNDDSNCNDTDYNGDISPKNTTNKLRVRKGRSIVHKNLEDNYGAVVIANHEALAQVLEQVLQSAVMQPSLRGLKTCTNLRWSDFTIVPLSPNKNQSPVKAGKRIFHSAVWNSNTMGPVNVTLMVHKEQVASHIVSQRTLQPFLSLNAVTEFCDLVPLQQLGENSEDLVQATIVVLARTQVDTIESYGEYLQSKNASDGQDRDFSSPNERQHEAAFVMLQVINGLKCLQARGVEEIPASLSSFVVCKDPQSSSISAASTSCSIPQNTCDERLPSIQTPKASTYGRLCIIQGLSEDNIGHNQSSEEKLSSLCECAISAANRILPEDRIKRLLRGLLGEERSVSLSQVKSVLEFTLWGPMDVVQGVPAAERELSLQRWLDLERATVLHGLVRTRVNLNTFERLHLMFLVRSSAKIMCDASALLESEDNL